MNRKVKWSVILSLFLVAAAGWAQETQTGYLTVKWGDPAPGVEAPPVLLFHFTTDDGVSQNLFVLPEAIDKAGGLLAVQNRRVTLDLFELSPSERRHLPPGTDRIASALRIAPDLDEKGREIEASPASRRSRAGVSGSQAWISLPCRFSDVAAEPEDQAFFQGIFGDDPGELNDFWKTESYGFIDIDGSQAEDWLGLPSHRASYVPAENACLNPALPNANLSQLFNDCVAAHDATVDFSSFVGINLLFNDDLDGCAWGGTQTATLDGVPNQWPVTWNPPFSYRSSRVFAHENGHGYGLPHSNNWDEDTSPYDNLWDYMSGGSYNSGGGPYTPWPTGGMAWHKEFLEWFTPDEVHIAQPGAQIVELDPLGLHPDDAGNKRMIKIPIGPSHWWTVEAREKTGSYEQGVPDTAVLISEIWNRTRDEPVWVYDDQIPPAGANSNQGTMWKVGETFTDVTNGVTVEVLSTLASGGFQVRVTTVGGACVPDSWEPDSASDGSEAQPIVSGVTKNHSICPVGDVDWSIFTLTEENAIVLETSGPGPPDDTLMVLRDTPSTSVEADDDDGAGLYSRIDRICGDPMTPALPPGTYYVEVADLFNDDEIFDYQLDLTVTPCPCPPTVTLDNQTINGTQTFQATMSATLGSALIVDGDDIRVRAADFVEMVNDTEIGGTFEASNSPVCPP